MNSDGLQVPSAIAPLAGEVVYTLRGIGPDGLTVISVRLNGLSKEEKSRLGEPDTGPFSAVLLVQTFREGILATSFSKNLTNTGDLGKLLRSYFGPSWLEVWSHSVQALQALLQSYEN